MAEVLLEVDDVLGDHDRVLDVVLHPFKALDALLTSVPEDINQDLSLKKSIEKLKGILHQKIFYRLNLIFWIVMGCGIARFGRRGLKTTET